MFFCFNYVFVNGLILILLVTIPVSVSVNWNNTAQDWGLKRIESELFDAWESKYNQTAAVIIMESYVW